LEQVEEGIAQDNQPDDEPPTPINSEELKERIAKINSLHILIFSLIRPIYLFYNAEKDYFVCPIGLYMEKIGNSTRKNDSGFNLFEYLF